LVAGSGVRLVAACLVAYHDASAVDCSALMVGYHDGLEALAVSMEDGMPVVKNDAPGDLMAVTSVSMLVLVMASC